jgi:outer membrane lipoprotein-sorting protein
MKLQRLLSLLLLSASLSSLYGQDAGEIIKKAEENLRGTSSIAEISMQIVRPSWTREIETKIWALGSEFALIYIKSPARDKGTVFLKRNQEIWNWQPQIQRQIKMPPSMLMQSWMGSDFTNDDLIRESSVLDDYTHRLLGKEEVNGILCYIIELTPKPDAPVVWGRVKSYISADGTYLQLKGEFFDEDDFLINTMIADEIQKMDSRLIPTRITMIPEDNPGHKTVMSYRSLQFNPGIADSFFSIRNMKNIRP